MASDGLTRALVIAVALGPIVACSLFVDTDGLSDGASTPGDGGNDATVDAPLPNDASAVEAGDDAGEAGPALRYCQAHPGHAFCLDFDDSDDVPSIGGAGFDPAKMYVDDASFVSPPHSLYVSFPAGESSEGIDEPMESTSSLSGSLDLRFDTTDLSSGQVVPLQIDYAPTSGVAEHFYYVNTYNGFFNFSEAVRPDDGGSTFYTSNTVATPVPINHWVHVDFAVTTGGHVTVSLDGTQVVDKDGQIGLTPGVAVTVSVGAYSNDLVHDVVEHLDNVVVDP